MSQFMPSNYRRLAVDGDGDGDIDLFEPVDAIHSIANYFIHHGWQNAQPVTSRVAVRQDFDVALIGRGLKPNHSVARLAEGGFYPQLLLAIRSSLCLDRNSRLTDLTLARTKGVAPL